MLPAPYLALGPGLARDWRLMSTKAKSLSDGVSERLSGYLPKGRDSLSRQSLSKRIAPRTGICPER
jgi:hypothetical protein